MRQKAKDITNLLTDQERLRQERRTRAHMRDRMLGQPPEEGDEFPLDNENASRRQMPVASQPPRPRDDEELKRAIEASKRSLAEEQARLGEDRDLARALKLSEEEEAKRARAVQDSNGTSLFDDQSQTYVVSWLHLSSGRSF